MSKTQSSVLVLIRSLKNEVEVGVGILPPLTQDLSGKTGRFYFQAWIAYRSGPFDKNMKHEIVVLTISPFFKRYNPFSF